jgi:DNA-binding helix-hairpin-helix protein with protein kinase domain
LAGVERTPQHDAFGLAVLVFHLLFMGRHPFAGRPLSRTDLSIEQAIKEYRFAFSVDRTRVQLDPPPHTLPLAAASPAIASLFERAFSKSASRPTPLEWNTALGALRGSLARCTKEASHAYFKGLSACPWCTIEASSGAVLFYSPQRAFTAPPVERDELGIGVVDALWRAIAAIQRPVQLQAPSITVLAPGKTASSEAVKAGAFASAVSKISYGVAAAAGFGALVATPQQPIAWGAGSIAGFWLAKLALSALNNGRVNSIALAYQTAKTQWDNIGLRWRSEADPGAFDAALTQYTRLRQEHDRLAKLIQSKVQHRVTNHTSAAQRWTADIARQALEIRTKVAHHQPITVALPDAELVAAYNMQMEAHLDRFSIEKADIPGIGASRKVKLASFGIETAADVLQHKVQGVPGFGPSLTKRLMDWRKKVKAKFRFDQAGAKRDVDAGRVRPSQAPQPPPPITVDEATKRRLRQIEADLSYSRKLVMA